MARISEVQGVCFVRHVNTTLGTQPNAREIDHDPHIFAAQSITFLHTTPHRRYLKHGNRYRDGR